MTGVDPAVGLVGGDPSVSGVELAVFCESVVIDDDGSSAVVAPSGVVVTGVAPGAVVATAAMAAASVMFDRYFK